MNRTASKAAAATQAAQPGRAAFVFIFITVAARHAGARHHHPGAAEAGGRASWAATRPGRRGIYGVFGTAWALMQFLFSPVLGALSDRFGRRPVILLSNLGLGLDYVLMALAPTLGWLFVGRVISGITAASFATGRRLHRRRDAARAARRALRAARRGVRARLRARAGARRPARQHRSAPAVLGRGGPRASPTPLYGFFVLPESLPRERRMRVLVAARQPARRAASCCARTRSCSGSRRRLPLQLAHEVLPSMSRALRRLPLRLGRAHGRALARGVGVCSRDRAGRAGRARRQAASASAARCWAACCSARSALSSMRPRRRG